MHPRLRQLLTVLGLGALASQETPRGVDLKPPQRRDSADERHLAGDADEPLAQRLRRIGIGGHFGEQLHRIAGAILQAAPDSLALKGGAVDTATRLIPGRLSTAAWMRSTTGA